MTEKVCKALVMFVHGEIDFDHNASAGRHAAFCNDRSYFRSSHFQGARFRELPSTDFDHLLMATEVRGFFYRGSVAFGPIELHPWATAYLVLIRQTSHEALCIEGT